MKVLTLFSILICALSAQAAIPSRSGIVGGVEAKPHALPWVVATIKGRKGRWNRWCGGTILCPKYVITAAHCAKGKDPLELRVVAGVHDMTLDEPSKTYHNVHALHIHPNYVTKDLDYAIIELADPIVLRPEARAAFLPDGSEPFKTVPRLIASGWGLMGVGTHLSDVLRSVTIPWVPNKKCHEAYPYEHEADIICAGDWESGDIGGCKGDSGSPLSFLDPKTDQVKVVGITSGGGADCVLPHFPGVYSDVAKQLDWVKSIIGECNQDTCDSGWCTRRDDLNPWTIEQFSRITPHLTAV